MVRDGVTWTWCPYHVHPKGEFNGLYCTHTIEGHVAWKAERNAKWGKKAATDATSKTPATSGAAAPAGAANKFAIGQRLKEVLCTKLMLSDEDADAYCQEIIQFKDYARNKVYGIK